MLDGIFDSVFAFAVALVFVFAGACESSLCGRGGTVQRLMLIVGEACGVLPAPAKTASKSIGTHVSKGSLFPSVINVEGLGKRLAEGFGFLLSKMTT